MTKRTAEAHLFVERMRTICAKLENDNSRSDAANSAPAASAKVSSSALGAYGVGLRAFGGVRSPQSP